jgi:hypothetical protein
MAALAALTFWGCSSQSANTRADDATGGSGQTAQSESIQGTAGDEAREQARDVGRHGGARHGPRAQPR